MFCRSTRLGTGKSGFLAPCLFIRDIEIYPFLFRSSLPTRLFRWRSLFYGCHEATKVGLERGERLLGGPVERSLDLLKPLPNLRSTALSLYWFDKKQSPEGQEDGPGCQSRSYRKSRSRRATGAARSLGGGYETEANGPR